MRFIKRAARWVYDWITVIVASLVGVPTLILQFLSFFDGVDITPFVGADNALKVVTGVALIKAMAAFIENQFKDE
jgi:hypothetical protein